MHTILLADPVGTRLMLERTCLIRHPHTVVEARCGSEALDVARQRRPRLIIFPGDMGAELIRSYSVPGTEGGR